MPPSPGFPGGADKTFDGNTGASLAGFRTNLSVVNAATPPVQLAVLPRAPIAQAENIGAVAAPPEAVVPPELAVPSAIPATASGFPMRRPAKAARN